MKPNQIDPQKKAVKAKAPGKAMQNEDKSQHAITIGKTPAEVFQFFRDFTNLPYFMKDIAQIEILDQKTSKWTAQLKNGSKYEWTAEITDERPNEFISWKSTKESEVQTEGSIWFEPVQGKPGTVVYLSMDYEVPGGKLGELVVKLRGEDPDTLAIVNLKRLKGFLETGVIATVEGQPSGREEVSDAKNLH